MNYLAGNTGTCKGKGTGKGSIKYGSGIGGGNSDL